MNAVFRCLVLLFLICSAHAHFAMGQTIWTGPTIEFEKPDNADPTLEQNQDRITDNVWITRNAFQPIYNAVVENAPVAASPTDTEWAFLNLVGNPADPAELVAANFANLNFNTFTVALGSAIGNTVIDRPGVLHLITDDIYIDIVFRSWTNAMIGSGGGFRYERSTEPIAGTLPGDYNEDGTVNAADYTVWRDNLGAPAGTLANDVDGGDIGQPQLLTWQSNFGATAAAASTLRHTEVPEPTSAWLLIFVGCGFCRTRRPG